MFNFMAKKKKVVEDKYTDILEERFKEDGLSKVKRTFMNGDKVVKEEIVND